MEKPILFDIQEVAWEEGPRPDIPRTAIFQGSEHMTIQYFELPSKSQGPPHTHVEEQIVNRAGKIRIGATKTGTRHIFRGMP